MHIQSIVYVILYLKKFIYSLRRYIRRLMFRISYGRLFFYENFLFYLDFSGMIFLLSWNEVFPFRFNINSLLFANLLAYTYCVYNWTYSWAVFFLLRFFSCDLFSATIFVCAICFSCDFFYATQEICTRFVPTQSKAVSYQSE